LNFTSKVTALPSLKGNISCKVNNFRIKVGNVQMVYYKKLGKKRHIRPKIKYCFISPPTNDPVKTQRPEKNFGRCCSEFFLLVFEETLAMPVCRNALNHGIFVLKRPLHMIQNHNFGTSRNRCFMYMYYGTSSGAPVSYGKMACHTICVSEFHIHYTLSP
jgi:hypothetical protein